MDEQTATPEAATPDAAKWTPDTETEARALGWKAPDEWKGEIPSGYIDDPSRYLERAESFAPFRKIREKMSEMEKTTQDVLHRIEATATKQIERERAESKAAIEAIKAQKLQAVEVGDTDTFKALDRREDQIRAGMQDQAKPSAVPDNHRTAIEAWSQEKPWFKADPIKTQAAVILYGQASQRGMSDPAAILAFVDSEMGKQFADMAPKRPASESVEAGLTFGAGPSQTGGFEKLPKDAKDAFRRFVDKGVFKDTKEDRLQYAEDYNAG